VDKAELRRGLGSLPPTHPEISSKVVANLFDFLSARLPGTVATYRALAGEVDVWSLVDRLPGWNWLLPRVEEDRTLTWRDARIDLETHRWGMEQPQAKGASVPAFHIDLFLVPGVGFDLDGNRIGRGGGYYDRELARRRPGSITIGVTTSDRVVAQIPVESHDVPMTHLVTERDVRATIPTR
jgi:5-formyltetrahydrofolate cyclo-ligase